MSGLSSNLMSVPFDRFRCVGIITFFSYFEGNPVAVIIAIKGYFTRTLFKCFDNDMVIATIRLFAGPLSIPVAFSSLTNF